MHERIEKHTLKKKDFGKGVLDVPVNEEKLPPAVYKLLFSNFLTLTADGLCSKVMVE